MSRGYGQDHREAKGAKDTDRGGSRVPLKYSAEHRSAHVERNLPTDDKCIGGGSEGPHRAFSHHPDGKPHNPQGQSGP